MDQSIGGFIMSVDKNGFLPNVLIILIVGILLLSFHVRGYAQPQEIKPTPIRHIKTGPVTILGKRHNTISLKKEKILHITKETTILNSYEEEIPLSKLPVPCVATIEYYKGKIGHTCTNITLVSYAKKSPQSKRPTKYRTLLPRR